jgi:NAD(P)-dependent dehydrogenase (short-subunit alcohol dehydrogenase family)
VVTGPPAPATELPAEPADQPARPALDESFWQAVERQDATALADTLGLNGDDDIRSSLGAVLPALSSWWRGQRDQEVIASWRYRIDWKPAIGLASHPPSGTWLVVLPAGQASHPLAEGCARAIAAGGWHQERLIVEVTDADPRRLARDLISAAGGQPVAGVLSLLALDETRHADQPAVPASLSATACLIRALDEAGIRARLWCATTGAVATPHRAVSNPVQAHLWGFGQVAGLEDADRLTGQIDLPATLDQEAAAQLRVALGHPGPEDQLTTGPAGLLARRLVPAGGRETHASGHWRPHGTSLVTGGTGALGSHVARWLAAGGAPHILLLSKRGDQASGAADLRRELTARGCQVTIAACDIGDRDQLASTLSGIPAAYPLTAIFHTAGAVDDCPVGDLTPQRMATVLGPKSAAAANLHELTLEADLSAFVLFSSYGSLLPNVGQASYAAANAYLDALASHRQHSGLPATSIAWGAWAGGGMAKDERFVRWIAQGGMRLLPPDLAITAMQQALDYGDAPSVIADVDWERFAAVFGPGRPRPLAAEIPAVASALAGSGEPALAATLAGLPRAHQETAILTAVRAEVARVLGHGHGSDIRPELPFRDLGLDSVTGVELRNRLTATTGLRLSRTAVFDYPTPAALAAQLLSQVSEVSEVSQAGQAEAEANGAPEAPSLIDSLPVEDLLQMANSTSHRSPAPDGPSQDGAADDGIER